VASTSMHCMESMSTPESSCRISGCSATTNSTTGLGVSAVVCFIEHTVFFNGVRIQIFPTEHLKIEPWLTNGWQSYGRFNGRPGVDNPERFLDKAAFSLTGDMGCEHSGGVSCAGNSAKGPKQSFLGYMIYNRLWFDRDKYGLTIGRGQINNPGRYLVLLPPINGATAASGTPYFTEIPAIRTRLGICRDV